MSCQSILSEQATFEQQKKRQRKKEKVIKVVANENDNTYIKYVTNFNLNQST